ncbi:hypothetical protein [Alkalibacterium sp. 20]|uniref:hypothetical protein n=1 Tax=Alkalibacterium sp. 20 TaxID=1798803 RepID=UPI0009003F80|nr:hypothetical protein [Alkalibacterium sp. 20]OJF90938.1 hypothetical protein AX762_03975 [Alkalibacterium sp. 20]
MSRKTSRIMAMGLLTASIVVMGMDLAAPSQINSTQAEASDSLLETVLELENKIDELEATNVRLTDEVDRLSEGYSETLALSDLEENPESDSDNGEDDEEDTEKAVTEEAVREFAITVREDEPSSVVAEQLAYFGVIDDRHTFNDFLKKMVMPRKCVQVIM